MSQSIPPAPFRLRRSGRRSSALHLTPLRAGWSGRALLAALLLLGLGAAAQAQTAPAPWRKGEAPRLSEAQRRQLFPEARALAVQDHRARIAILQQSERCIAAAADGDAMRQCLRQERQAMQNQRERHHRALRQSMQKLGIALPEGGRRSQGPQDRPPMPPDGWDHPRQPSPAI